MIIAPVRARFALAGMRLDAKYHCSFGVQAAEHLVLLKAAGVLTRTVAGPEGLGWVAPTTRTKRVYAGPGEEHVPYLRPYDVFDYLPQTADLLSKSGSPGVEELKPKPGCILQTCSGRNLGPLVYADSYLSRFAVSDDMLRLHIQDEQNRLYALTFLSTPTGQALLTRNKTGGVIDHLSAKDLGAVEVPFLSPDVVRAIAKKMGDAVRVRQEARIVLSQTIEEYELAQPSPVRDTQMREGWTKKASELSGRLDSAFHDPLVRVVRRQMLEAGGVRCGDVAKTFIPGRYTRYYVEPEHGRPIVSGRQLLQAKPVNLRYIAARSLDYGEFELHENMLAFGAEGRAEERLATPTMITKDRAGWLANNHVMRVSPREGIDPGWLFLAFAAWQTQAQVKACSCGSVVDTVYPTDLNEVILPPIDKKRAVLAAKAWKDLARANALESEAIAFLEAALQERVATSA